MLIGSGGILKDFFGLGVGSGDLNYTTDIDLTQTQDYFARNISFEKASGGDPDFTVVAYGQRYVAARKITVGAGVTLLGKDNTPGGYHLGAPGYTIGSGTDGGTEVIGNLDGNAGTASGHARGGNGGTGGNSPTKNGGGGGLASVTGLFGAYNDPFALIHGHVIGAGTVVAIDGGAGGGSGAGGIAGTGGQFGGGGGGVIILAAPVIEIAGTVDVSGKFGISPLPVGTGGGGGGGGGGLIILLYGELIMTGTLLFDGGHGGDGFSPGSTGGGGGHGGRVWQYSGDPETFIETIGATGAAGADG